MTALLGADPELFVTDVSSSIVPIFDLVGGTKENPLPILSEEHLKAGGRNLQYTFQEDGAALEFNIPPTGSADKFESYISYAMAQLYKWHLMPRGLNYARGTNAMRLSPAQLAHPKAATIGCSSDHYAYDSKLPNYERQPFTAKDLGDMRYAGGHLHIAYCKQLVPPFIMAKYMDIVVGLTSVSLDKQGGRRKYYGLPGLYREKPYGIEYRTLSNFWLFSGQGYVQMMAANALNIAQCTYDERFVDTVLRGPYDTLPWGDVHTAIANEDDKLATMLLTWLNKSKGFDIRTTY